MDAFEVLGDEALRLRLLAQQQRLLPTVRPPQALLENAAQRLDERSLRLGHGLQKWLQARQLLLARLCLPALRERWQREQLRLAQLSARLTPQTANRSLERARQTCQRLGEKLEVLSYHNTLARGFAVVRNARAQIVSSAAQANGPLTVEFKDGRVEVKP